MRPLYTALVWLVVAMHFAFLIYLPVGGFVALRWPRTIWLHVAAVLWGVATVALRLDCPLTDVERWARARAGMEPISPAGFIDHYLTGVLYPAGSSVYAHATVLLAVLASWALYTKKVS